MVYQFTTANFTVEVQDSDIPVLVDFYAEWCGPCKMMEPIVKDLEEIYDGKVMVGKLNIDENMEIAQKYKVMSVPTFMIFKKGEPVETMIGAMSKAEMEEKIKKVLGEN